MNTQKYSGANTSANTTRLPALFKIITKRIGWTPGTVNVDLGCGRDPGNVTRYLNTVEQVYNIPSDPHWGIDVSPTDKRVLETMRLGSVTISNVLNVIKEKKARLKLLERAANLTARNNAPVYIKVYEGDKTGTGRQTKRDCWQLNRRSDAYLAELKSVFPVVEKKYGILIAHWR